MPRGNQDNKDHAYGSVYSPTSTLESRDSGIIGEGGGLYTHTHIVRDAHKHTHSKHTHIHTLRTHAHTHSKHTHTHTQNTRAYTLKTHAHAQNTKPCLFLRENRTQYIREQYISRIAFHV
jgi:hypothetical protein